MLKGFEKEEEMERINRRNFLKAAGIAAAGLTGKSFGMAAKRNSKKQNFVFILVDDLGYMDIGVNNPDTFYETPNIDRLASQGMRFTDAYAACPVCSPTRASIMAGKYPARMDTTDWFGAPQPERAKNHWTGKKKLLPASYVEQLPLKEVTIAEALKEAGYNTFFAGKWHLGPTEEYWPENQGFDVNKGGWLRGGPYGPGKYFVPYGNPRLEDGPKGEHLPDRLATETVKFIKQNKDNPFLAYLSFYSVHTPLISREDLKQKYLKKKEKLGLEAKWGQDHQRKVRLVQEHAVYAGMVEAMDMACGKVLEALKELGLEDNTAIFFMSDNGGLSTSEGSPTSNLPLRGGKGWLYEGGIREPMIIKWPGVTKAGSTCGEPVISTDFYPTMLQMAGLELKPAQHIDGVSLVPLLKGKRSPKPRPIFWHYPHYGNQGGSPGAAVRLGDYKLIEFFEDDHIELYDLKKDIGEKKDLSKKMPKKAAQFRKILNDWQKEVDAKMPTPNPDYDPDYFDPKRETKKSGK
jgi:arylsulfatase A-like enzyme